VFEFQIRYKPGRFNQAADELSRIQTDGYENADLDLEVPVLTVGNPKKLFQSISVPRAGPTLEEVAIEPLGIAELIDAQAVDADCIQLAEKGDALEDERGILVRTSSLDGAVQAVIPESLQGRCLALFHVTNIAGMLDPQRCMHRCAE
jgi:hypothetical protein